MRARGTLKGDNTREAIAAALAKAGLSTDVASVRDLSGGCIHQVMQITLADGLCVVAKLNSEARLALFEEESHSLAVLAKSGAVIVPRPLATIAERGIAALLMTYIEPPAKDWRGGHGDEAWRNFGRDLAALHCADAAALIPQSAGRYGFDIDNHIGSTLQPNAWHDDWVEFNAINRLGFQLAAARDAGLLNRAEADRVQRVIDQLERLIPRRPRPSLLHGDLWSGNVLPAIDTRESKSRATFAMIDPACSVGDQLADIAMMHLFGGFPAACFESYEQEVRRRLESNDRPDTDSDEYSHSIENRISVYQLYHVLNHVNIFGRGYVDQAMRLCDRVL